MRRRAFLEMLAVKEDLRAADLDALAARAGLLIGRDLAEQPPILMKQLMAMARHDCSGRLAGLAHIPTLVISAQYDRIALPAYGRALARAIRGASCEEIAAASHGLPILNPPAVNDRIARFIRSAEAATA